MTALFKFTHLFSGTPGLCAVWAFPSYGEWGCSLVVVHRLSCPVACGILVPGPGIEPVTPALAVGFLTTGPARKSLTAFE